jgi:hypothetical protein
MMRGGGLAGSARLRRHTVATAWRSFRCSLPRTCTIVEGRCGCAHTRFPAGSKFTPLRVQQTLEAFYSVIPKVPKR